MKNDNKKIAIVGSHGVGKSKICDSVLKHIYSKHNYDLFDDHSKFNLDDSHDEREYAYPLSYQRYDFISDYANLGFISDQFREVVKNIPRFKNQTEEITLATYAKQLYLENLYTAQGKHILCDRSVLDTFVYYDYFSGLEKDGIRTGSVLGKNYNLSEHILSFLKQNHSIFGSYNDYNDSLYDEYGLEYDDWYFRTLIHEDSIIAKYIKTYHKIYLIEPSDRPIENDGFRLIDKESQKEVHNLFLECFENFSNVAIINQEEQDNVVNDVVGLLNV